MLHALLVSRAPVNAHPADRPPAQPRPHYRALARTRAMHLRLRRVRRLPRPLRWALAAALVLLVSMPWVVQAQNIYRTVDGQGRTTFSDRLGSAQPPSGSPPTVSGGPAAAEAADGSADLPYALRQARSKYPVTFYATGDCPPCDDARRMLVQRGVPYTERSVGSEADRQALRALSGQEQLPFATIGQQHLVGWEADSWQRYLDLAGYPSRSVLAAPWKPGTATALAPSPAAPAAPTSAPAQRPDHTAISSPSAPSAPRVDPRNPTGITF